MVVDKGDFVQPSENAVVSGFQPLALSYSNCGPRTTRSSNRGTGKSQSAGATPELLNQERGLGLQSVFNEPRGGV